MHGCPKSLAKKNLRRRKLGAHFTDDTKYDLNINNPNSSRCNSVSSSIHSSSSCSSNLSSTRCQSSSYMNSTWTHQYPSSSFEDNDHEKYHCSKPTTFAKHGLIGSIRPRIEGHIYSLAAAGDLLYTGSQSKNVRVWKNLEEFSGFKSGSGLVKAIVVLGDRVFTGHQDGKIRIWGVSGHGKSNVYPRVGSLPTTWDLLKKSINPKSYVRVRRKRSVPWIKHYDAVSCMSIDVDQGLLYSGSWDKTLKVWRISDSKCTESIHAHDDAVNAVAAAFNGIVFSGSADGTVKAWRREVAVPKRTKHVLMETLLNQKHALTSLSVSHASRTVYAGSSNGLVSFWERGRLKPQNISVLRGHKLAVLCLAVAGNLVMSGSADRSICVWRRDVGGVHACMAVLTGHTGPVKCLTVEKDTTGVVEEKEIFPASLNGPNTINGNLTEGNERWIVYSGSLDKSVKVWRVSEHARPELGGLQDDME